MIIITGSVEIRESCLQDAIALSLKHVKHSRSENGCISHAVHQDVENPAHLFFFEQWTDENAIKQHFALESSQQFVKNLSSMCAAKPVLTQYEAKPL